MGLAEKDFTFRQTTVGGIPFRLMPGYPTFNVTEDSSTAQEQYLIEVSNFQAFVLESFPVNFGEEDLFAPPKRAMPGAPFFTTKTLAIKPFQDRCADPFDVYDADSEDREGAFTKYMLVDIAYETQAFGDDEGEEPDQTKPEEFLEHNVTSGGEALLVPWRNVVAESAEGDAKPFVGPGQMNNIVQLLPSCDHVFKWKSVRSPPWSKIIPCLGKVNDATFKAAFDAAKETLLFSGVTGTQRFMWNGKTVRRSPWDIEFRMSQRVIPGDKTWNHVYHPDLGWIRVTKADGNPVYSTTDFSAMFKAGT